MRRSRLLLLVLLPVYGVLLSFTLHFSSDLDTLTWQVLALANPMIIVSSISTLLLRTNGGIGYVIVVVLNVAFWLPVAHLTDALLEKVRRRRARRHG